jgi:hypothetical protein
VTESRLKELTARLKMLDEEAVGGGEEAQAGLRGQMDALKEKCRAAERKVKDLEEADEDSWEGLTSGVEEAMEDLRAGLESAANSRSRSERR